VRNVWPPTSTPCSNDPREVPAVRIDETPYVVVKADAGTYGMGVMTVKDAAQVTGLSRRQRNKMSVIKEGLAVSQVIIQEGVHTYERVGSGKPRKASPNRWST
jgi:hypothetical protein